MSEIDQVTEPERKLWAYVLLQAVTDLKGRDLAARSARAWFNSRDKTIGSLEWICHHMSLDPDAVRESVLSNKAAELRASIASQLEQRERAA
jgi:hypothetical protein